MSAEHPALRLHTATSAAAELGVGVKAIRALVAAGRLKYVVLPGRRRRLFLMEDLRAALEGEKRAWDADAAPSSGSRRVRNTSTTTGPSKVVDFEAALARATKASPPR